MRILAICNLFPPYQCGGNEIRFRDIVLRLRDKHDVCVLTSKPPEKIDDPDWIKRELSLVYPYPEPLPLVRGFLIKEWWISWSNYLVCKQYIDRFRPDVIYLSDTKRTFLGPAVAAQAAGVPVVWDITDTSLSCYNNQPFIRSFSPYINFQDVDFNHALVISPEIAQNLQKKEVLNTNAEVLRQGVDRRSFYPSMRPSHTWSCKKLLWIGSLIADKGLHIVLEALPKLLSINPNYTLTVCGTSGDLEYQKRLQQICRDHNIEDHVCFEGAVPFEEVPEYYRNHDAYIFSSLWEEPFASTPLEAMASGIPVVGTAVGGQKSFFKDGQNCLVYEKENADKLAKCLISLNNYQLYHKLVDCALKQIQEKFDFDHYCQRIEKKLLQVAWKNAS